jgi:hypothetical protein
MLVRYALEDVLMKFGVDLTIWAHEHSYERLWPIYNLKVYNGSYEEPYRNPKALVHVTTGSAVKRYKVALDYDYTYNYCSDIIVSAYFLQIGLRCQA